MDIIGLGGVMAALRNLPEDDIDKIESNIINGNKGSSVMGDGDDSFDTVLKRLEKEVEDDALTINETVENDILNGGTLSVGFAAPNSDSGDSECIDEIVTRKQTTSQIVVVSQMKIMQQ